MKQHELNIHKFLLIAIFIIAFIESGCATPQYTTQPFQIDQEKFYKKIKTIALEPLQFYEDLENPEQVRDKFEPLISTKLSEAGFSIIPSQEYEKIWNQTSKSMGGCFDPVTGKRDESKIKAIRELCFQDLRTKFNADAVLHSSIEVVPANFSNCKAKWHGISEEISRTWLGFFCVNSELYGQIKALSLIITIEDVEGHSLYTNGGGIQVLNRLNEAFLTGGKFVPVTHDSLFTNEERNQASVNIALSPFIR